MAGVFCIQYFIKSQEMRELLMCKCIAKIVGRRMRKPLILLHLSDIHFGRNRDERIKESDFSHKEYNEPIN